MKTTDIDVNHRDSDGATILTYYLYSQNVDNKTDMNTINFLVKRGANPFLKDNNGISAKVVCSNYALKKNRNTIL